MDGKKCSYWGTGAGLAPEAKLCKKAFLSDLCRINDTAKEGAEMLYES